MGALAGWRWAAAALLLVTLAPDPAPAAGRAQGPLLGYLPADGAAAGWVRDGGPQEFEGEDLYTYIDGGAEIYQEYGFRRAVVQDYRNAAGREVSLEIFEMADAGAAYGIFSFKRSGEGRSLALGGGGELEDYYLNFWKGCFVVTLTGFDETEATLAGLLALGRAVDAKIGQTAEAPALVAVLPGEGLKAGSVKYLRGLLGLTNVYPFGTARGLTFKDAVRGQYSSGETLIILEYGTAEARHSAWLELQAGIEKSGRFERPTNYLADAVVFKDGQGRYVAIGEAGPRLAIGIHSTLDWALATAARVR
jgi:hypothetical protein